MKTIIFSSYMEVFPTLWSTTESVDLELSKPFLVAHKTITANVRNYGDMSSFELT